MRQSQMESPHTIAQENQTMGYRYLNITERSQLNVLFSLGWSYREIGKELGRPLQKRAL